MIRQFVKCNTFCKSHIWITIIFVRHCAKASYIFKLKLSSFCIPIFSFQTRVSIRTSHKFLTRNVVARQTPDSGVRFPFPPFSDSDVTGEYRGASHHSNNFRWLIKVLTLKYWWPLSLKLLRVFDIWQCSCTLADINSVHCDDETPSNF